MRPGVIPAPAAAPPWRPARLAAGPDPRTSAATALSLHGVVRRWRSAPAPVLGGVDLRLEPGTCAFLGGCNGAGKTTLLRIAAGLIMPDAGEVSAFALSPREHRARYHRAVSMLAAGDRGLYARLTVRGQLEFCARIALLAKHELAPARDRALARFDLAALAGRRVDRMSTGQRQRLRLAIAFLASPRLVLLDEPLASLDGHGAELLAAALDDLCASGGAALWCSPQDDAARLEHLPQGGRWVLAEGRLRPC